MKLLLILRLKVFLFLIQFTKSRFPTPTALDHENNYSDNWYIEHDNQSTKFSTAYVSEMDLLDSNPIDDYTNVTNNGSASELLPEKYTNERENLTELSNNSNNNYYDNVPTLSETNKISTSTYSSMVLTALISSMQQQNITKQAATLSFSPTNRKFTKLRRNTNIITDTKTKPAFWDYGDKDNVESADYDYQAVLKDEPDENCFGFLRSRRNCRSGYGDLGVIGILFIGFSFILVLLLCACKGCRCVQILLKRRSRYLPVSTKD